jgi:hypothetical protein
MRTVDHVIPLSGGGGDVKSNKIPCCGHCNHWKRDMSLGDFRASKFKASRFKVFYFEEEYAAKDKPTIPDWIKVVPPFNPKPRPESRTD